jgi:hypothetical protein
LKRNHLEKEGRKEMKKDQKKNNLFFKRMLDLGYDDVTEFARTSRIPLSFETCRRAIYDNRQNIRLDYIVILMQSLDFTVNEIKEELKARGDKSLHKLISDSEKGVTLNSQEKRIIDKMRKEPDLVPIIIGQINLMGRKEKKG